MRKMIRRRQQPRRSHRHVGSMLSMSRLITFCLLFLLLIITSHAESSIEVGVDICENDNQCSNGGVCAEPNENHSHKYCHCAVGYVGVRCNSFCPLECQNGGYCRYEQMLEPRQFDRDRNPSDYICQCFGLFEGKYCEIPYMNCGDGRRCYNGGICRQVAVTTNDSTETTTTTTTTSSSSTCDCPSGFGGDTCQSYQQENLPSTAADDGFEGNKTALAAGITFIVIFCAFCSWYTINNCIEEDISYEQVEPQTNDVPAWRHVV